MHLGLQHPRGVDGGHAGGDVLGLVAADQVEGQGRAAVVHVSDLAIGHQTQLDQRLEAVADAQHQAVAVFQQVMHRVLDAGIAEEGGDELAGALGLVAAGEAAGQNDHLGALDGLLQRLGRLGQQVVGQVAHHQDLRLDAGAQAGVGGVVLAVRAGEHRDDRTGTGGLDSGSGMSALGEGDFVHHLRLMTQTHLAVEGGGGVVLLDLLQLLRGVVVLLRLIALETGGIDILQRVLPHGAQVVQRQICAAGLQNGREGGAADALAAIHILGQLRDDGAASGGEELLTLEGVHAHKADLVAEAHLHQALGHAAAGQRPGGAHLTGLHQRVELLPHGQRTGVIALGGSEQVNGIVGLLELRGQHVVGVRRGDGEAHQRGRHVHVEEGAGHGVLAADGSGLQADLGAQRTQQGGEGLAPARGLVPQLLKVLLQGEVGQLRVSARSGQLGDRLHHGLRRAHEGVALTAVGVEAEGHDGAGFRFMTRADGQQRRHGLRRALLLPAAEGHQHGGRADGAVEPLHQAALGGHIGVGGDALEQLHRVGGVVHVRPGVGQGGNGDGDVLVRAIAGEESAAQVGDLHAVPVHDHPGLLGDDSHLIGLQILRRGGGDELLRVLGADDDGHALLRLGNGQLRAVQTVILLAHGVQVDGQAVGQLADGDADAACAKVVAALDHAGDVAVAEQALDLALLGGVALLHLGGHGLQRLLIVALGGAGGAADAVAAGAAAQQDDHVAGGGLFPHHVGGGSGAHDCAQLQVLGHIAGVVELADHTGGKADLVAVGGIARRGGGTQLALGQLTGQRLVHGGAGVAAAGDAHGLIHIGAAGQRVTDRAADAGGRTAEGLDLGGVVMGLVLEHEQPVLLLAVHVHGDVDGAGVDLLALVQVGQLAALFQHLGAQRAHVHQGLGALGGLLLAVDLHPAGEIGLIGLLHLGVVDVHRVDVGAEGGVAAVVRPVGVHQTQLGDGGVALLLVPEISLEEFQVIDVHGKAVLAQHGGKTVLVLVPEAVQRGDGGGDVIALRQRLRLVHGGLPGLHGVDEVAADLLHVRLIQLAHQDIDLGTAHQWPLTAGQQLDALGAGVRPLVKLTGQGLHSEDGVLPHDLGHLLVIERVAHRLGEHGGAALQIDWVLHAVHIVTAQDANARQGLDAQLLLQLLEHLARFHVETGALFRIATKHIIHTISNLLDHRGRK